MHTYYSHLRPLGIGCYPVDESNPVIKVEDYAERLPVFGEGWEAWGSITYRNPLPLDVKEHYGFFEASDADGSRKLEERARRIAAAVARKSAASAAEAERDVLAMLADSEEARSMRDREIMAAMVEFYGATA